MTAPTQHLESPPSRTPIDLWRIIAQIYLTLCLLVSFACTILGSWIWWETHNSSISQRGDSLAVTVLSYQFDKLQRFEHRCGMFFIAIGLGTLALVVLTAKIEAHLKHNPGPTTR